MWTASHQTFRFAISKWTLCTRVLSHVTQKKIQLTKTIKQAASFLIRNASVLCMFKEKKILHKAFQGAMAHL